jgi:hypothetical protein
MFGRKKKNEATVKQNNSGNAPEKQSQLVIIKDAYKLVRRDNPKSLVWCVLAFAIVMAVGIFIGNNLGHPIYFGLLAFPLSILVAFYLFSRFANTAAFKSIEGQLGAGASVLMSIRRGVVTTPAVNVTRSQDMVHRASSKAGIILIGEGGFSVRSLIQDERRKMERFVPGVPITEVVVGNSAGQVSLKKLQKHVKKLPKKLNTAQLREVRARLKAVGGLNIPLPKGPMPKNIKLPKR